MGKYAFVGGTLIDGTGAAPIKDSLVLVDDKKITYAGKKAEIPEGFEVRDISGRTIMPGLIDTHLHFSGNLTDDDNDWVIETVAQKRNYIFFPRRRLFEHLLRRLRLSVLCGRYISLFPLHP